MIGLIGDRQAGEIVTHRKNVCLNHLKRLKPVMYFTNHPSFGIIESYRGLEWDSWPRTAGVCLSELQPSQKRFLAKWSQLSAQVSACLRLTDDCGEDDEAEGERCKYDDNQVKILHQGELQRLSSFSDRGEQQTTDDTISYWSRFASSIKLLNIKLKGLPSPKRCHSHQGVFINYVTGGGQ